MKTAESGLPFVVIPETELVGHLFNVPLDDLEFVTRRVVETPMLSSSALNARIGRTIHVKDETAQRGGSFKNRGAILGVRNAGQGVVAA